MADQKPGIFISHTGADAELANAVDGLVKRVFGGAITVWHSSDRSPLGGIKPGDEWFTALHGQLKASTRVFSLVTPQSISRPWVYWESGIGSVICPGRVTPILFRIGFDELHPPLSFFQSVNGLDAETFADSLAKIATEADLSPDSDWVAQCVHGFVSQAETLVSNPDEGVIAKDADPLAVLYGPLQNIAERLDKIEREVSRKPSKSVSSARKTIFMTTDDIARAVAGNEAAIQHIGEAISSGSYSLVGVEQAIMRYAIDAASAEKLIARLRIFSSPSPQDEPSSDDVSSFEGDQ